MFRTRPTDAPPLQQKLRGAAVALAEAAASFSRAGSGEADRVSPVLDAHSLPLASASQGSEAAGSAAGEAWCEGWLHYSPPGEQEMQRGAAAPPAAPAGWAAAGEQRQQVQELRQHSAPRMLQLIVEREGEPQQEGPAMASVAARAWSVAY